MDDITYEYFRVNIFSHNELHQYIVEAFSELQAEFRAKQFFFSKKDHRMLDEDDIVSLHCYIMN